MPCVRVVYAINIGLRASSFAVLGAPLVLSIIGVALLFVSGWLRSQIVHVYGVGAEDRK
ncbi:MAG TPA: hypothetical protein VNF46_03585 [Gammaproteobacteria bacterium]|nr:hypothetical protein [Gammaproteobacteria bacterium]